MQTFFSPKSVAVIGASRDPNKLGYIVFSNFVNNNFKHLYPINPNADEILGRKCYKSVLDVKGDIDLVVIIIPAKSVLQALSECIKKKVKSVVIITSGFSETGEVGRKLEDELKQILQKTKTRVIGPNCIGIYDAYSGVDTLFLSRERCMRPVKGSISFITQSGAVGSTILDVFYENKIGISKFVSYGNGVDVTETDLIDFLGKDNKTKVIIAYLEGLKDSGSRFMKVAKKVTRKKPVIVLKAGKSSKGMQAVSSHTGSLAGQAQIYSAAFKQSGILEASNWEELQDYAMILSTQPLPKSNRLAIITDGGGFGVLATDEAERLGFSLPEPSEMLKTKLKSKMPEYVSLKNPIDLTGDADAERYKIAINTCLSSNEYDLALVISLFQVPTLSEQVVNYIREAKKFKKPIAVCSVGSNFSQTQNMNLMQERIPVYPSPERAVKALKSLIDYKKML
ncbi:MAG: CoA-binding protein [Candidatus Aenigmarchaeota archaeon]|nr:CoA-binding protein [Candidatus Aenigmarchaeota archaeon]